MELNRKKSVQVTIDGNGPYSLHLEVDTAIPDDDLAIRLVHILSRVIQDRPYGHHGIQWDQQHLRQQDEFLRRIVERFHGAWGPPNTRGPARSRSPRTSAPRPTSSILPMPKRK